MNKPIGGRGKKAPYETVVIRVPKDLEKIFEEFCEDYRTVILSEKLTSHSSAYKFGIYSQVSAFVAIEEACKILRQKKSAKQSILKLLQVLYPKYKVEDEDLK